jgi:two-component system phosphate regulon sensor histidine kinase PhoR
MNGPGMGLGLSLVQEVVDLHGCKILVESNPQKGSRFSIVLRVKKRSEEKEVGRRPKTLQIINIGLTVG